MSLETRLNDAVIVIEDISAKLQAVIDGDSSADAFTNARGTVIPSLEKWFDQNFSTLTSALNSNVTAAETAKGDAEDAQEAAETAQTAAETARSNAVNVSQYPHNSAVPNVGGFSALHYATEADNSRTDALTYRNDAERLAQYPVDSTIPVIGGYSALHYRYWAQQDRIASVQAKYDAESAQGIVAGYASTASDAEVDAQQHRDDAEGFAGDASDSEIAAAASELLALRYAQHPHNSTIPSVGGYSALHYATEAIDSAVSAAADKVIAQNLAQYAEDSVVPTVGGFSAFHWAKKAEADAATALTRKNDANTSAENAATSEGNASDSEEAAGISAGNASTSETRSGQYAQHPEDSTIPVVGGYSALHWAKKAEADAGLAEAERIAVQGTQAQADTARDQARDYRDEAFTYQGQAEGFKDDAETAESNASISATKSEQYAGTAKDAFVPGTTDYSSKHYSLVASDLKDEAEAARDLAEDWASAPEGIEVETGKYSAYHYSRLAAVEVAGIGNQLTVVGGHDASTGSFPLVPPADGGAHFYSITAAGSLTNNKPAGQDNIIAEEGDFLFYDTSTDLWVLMKNAENITADSLNVWEKSEPTLTISGGTGRFGISTDVNLRRAVGGIAMLTAGLDQNDDTVINNNGAARVELNSSSDGIVKVQVGVENTAGNAATLLDQITATVTDTRLAYAGVDQFRTEVDGARVLGNMYVDGDLNVTGTTTFTDVENISTTQTFITLNEDHTGAATENAGFTINRGSDADVSFFWNEADDGWDFGGTKIQNITQLYSDTGLVYQSHLNILTLNGTGDHSQGVVIAGPRTNIIDDFLVSTSGGVWGDILTVNTTDFTYEGNDVWHQGNMGPGSGLDADTLDGHHAAAMLKSNAADIAEGNLTFRGGIKLEDQDIYMGDRAIVFADGDGAFSDRSGTNIDHIWFDDATNTFTFAADDSYKGSSNAVVRAAVFNEGGTVLSNKYLGINSKAVNSEKLDNLDSTQFLRADAASVLSAGNLTINDGLSLRFGTDADSQIFHNGTGYFIRNNTGKFLIDNFDNDQDIEFRTNNTVGDTTSQITIVAAEQSVYLKHAGIRRLSTKATGVDVNGVLDVNSPASAPQFIENGTSLNAKYLGLTAKAADANLLDGLNGSHYLDWNNLTNVPATFTPSAHTHTEAQITDLDKYTQSEVDGFLAGKAAVGHNHNLEYLGISATAENSDKLGNVAAANFSRLDIEQTHSASIRVADSQYINAGDGADRIYLSYLTGAGRLTCQTGDMRITTNENSAFVRVKVTDDTATVQDSIVAGGATPYVRLYHDNNERLQTKDSGIMVTGRVEATVDATAPSFIENGTALTAKYLGITAQAADSAQLGGLAPSVFMQAGSAFTKTSGALTFADNVFAGFGADNDLSILHDGTNSRIDGTAGEILIRNLTDDQSIKLESTTGASTTTALEVDAVNELVKLNQAGSTKLATKSIGIDVTGDIDATGDVTANASDIRLKDVYEEGIENARYIVDSWDTIRYTMNDLAGSFGFDTEKKYVGLKAHQVREFLPEAVPLAPFDKDKNGVSESGEEYLTIQYERTVPVLVAAQQETNRELEEKDKVIEDLNERLERLEAALEALTR